MSKLSLSYAGHFSDRVQDLYYGVVKPEAIDLSFVPLQPFQAFNRFLRGEFHCGEMSFSTFTIMTAQAKAKGESLPFVGIPAFPSRTFRHGAIYVNRKSDIRQPQDLNGKRIGVPEYQMTAAVWARGMLMHEYGVDPATVKWTTGGIKDPGRKPMISVEIPNIDIRHESEKSLNDMLVAGELDAMIAPQHPPALRAGHPDLGLLFPDTVSVEQAYMRKTGLFPIMHVVVIRCDVYEQHPWVAFSLFEAFERAKNNCLERLSIEEPPAVSIPWAYQLGRSVVEVRGKDFWPYGVGGNLKEIEALCQYTWEQGLVPTKVGIADLFPVGFTREGSLQL
jgi:4,5-dihydroxyphthalate decarboxylase